MQILVTRPRGEADLFAVALAMRGHDAVVAPLLDIVVDDAPPLDLAGVQAVLFTSANGVRAFAHTQKSRDLKAFCVGDATAAAARNAGFGTVESASGDVETLAALVQKRLDPKDGTLIHATGTAVAGDLAGVLGAEGFAVRRVQLYRADTATKLPDEAAEALRSGRIDVVTFFSPRTAEIFARLVHEAGLDASLARVTALALAPTALEIAREQGCRFKTAIAADQPNEAALLAAVDRLAEAPDAPVSEPRPGPAAAKPASVPPSPASQPAPSRGLLLLFVMALLAGGIGAGGALYWQNTMVAPKTSPSPTVALPPATGVLEQRLAAVDRRLSQIEQRPAATVVQTAPGNAVDLGPLESRLEALESRAQVDPGTQAALAAMMAENRRLAGELARIQAEVERLQGGIVEQTADRAAVRRAEFRLAVGQLRDAALAGRPFAAELALVREMAGEARRPEDFAALAQAAERGLETRASLVRRFPPLANAMVAAARTGDIAGRWGELLERLQGLLSIRRVGEIAGDDASARVARAEVLANAGDLEGALAAFDGVQGAAWIAPARGWLEVVRLRLAVEREIAALAAAGGG
ncbi:MAG: uroporphyrinogen-III synthase [Telmatospirillum sp.]|nr:uroporphyrinogen-III synthase [Telmatospirillum sp.]